MNGFEVFYNCSKVTDFWLVVKVLLFSFSLDSDSIFGKLAPCQLLRLNFKNKSEFF